MVTPTRFIKNVRFDSICNIGQEPTSVLSHTVLYKLFDIFENIGMQQYITEIYKLTKLLTSNLSQ